MTIELKTWCMLVEFTFPILDDDIAIKHQGDSEVDFADRAFYRIRPHLETLLKNSPIEHFHLSALPRQVVD